MKLIRSLSLNYLKKNKKRTLMTIFAICLSAALIFTVLNMVYVLRTSLIDYVKTGEGEFNFKYENASSYIDTLKINRDVDGNLGVLNFLGSSRSKSKNEYKPYLALYSADSDSLKRFNFKLKEGRLAQNRNEVIIPDTLNLYGKLNLKLGDYIDLDYIERFSDEGKIERGYLRDGEKFKSLDRSERLKVVGIVDRFTSQIESFDDAAFTLITKDSDKDKVVSKDAYFSFKSVDDYYKKLENIFSDDADNVIINSPLIKLQSYKSEDSEMKMILALGIFLVFIIVISSIAIIGSSFSISTVEKKKEYGILKSLGARDKDLAHGLRFEGLVLGLVGSIFGVILGLLASFIVSAVINSLLVNFISGMGIKFKISLIALMVAFSLGVITSLISSSRQVISIKKISPIEAIKGTSDILIRKKDVKIPKFISSIFGIGGEISYKNMKRNRKRYRASVIAISISIIVFISIYSLVSQLEKSVRLEHAYKNYNLVSYINRSTNETDNGSIDEYRKNLDKLVKSVIEDEEYSIVKRFYAYMETKYLSEDLLKFFQEKQGYSKDDKSIGITINVLDDKSFEKTLKENGLKGNGLYLACNEYFIKTDDGKKYSFKSFKDKSISYSYDQNNYRNEEIENPISFKEDVNLEFIKKFL